MAGPESLADHVRRLGPLPPSGHGLVETLDRSGVVGRGGAWFPVGTKWRSVAAKSRGAAVVIVNGAEGEPQSRKDRLLMTTRPHLILDGAFLAARTVHAKQVVVYVGEEFEAARAAMARALGDRPEAGGRPRRIRTNEESAARPRLCRTSRALLMSRSLRATATPGTGQSAGEADPARCSSRLPA